MYPSRHITFIQSRIDVDGIDVDTTLLRSYVFSGMSASYLNGVLNEWVKPVINLGLDARKPVLEGLRTTQVQTSLRIRTVCSAPLLVAF